MIIQIEYNETVYQCNLSKPIDISIPVGQVKCFYATDYETKPYVSGDFIGSVKAGAPVNFYDVLLNPHGNGTHTECLGHITVEQESVNQHLKQFHFVASLASIPLTKIDNGDHIITKEALEKNCLTPMPEALVLRTLPNHNDKETTDYSGTNPPYIDKEAMCFLVEHGVKHLLLDLPSVDREEDDGVLQAHHIFWNVEGTVASEYSRKDCTITELIYVPSTVDDGLYLLNIQIPSIELDAAPSKPVLYKLDKAD